MTEVSWWQARTLAGEAMGGSSSEVVPLVDALGRTLASDAAALTDLPGFPTAAMDGWVVCGPGPWTIVGTIDTGASSVVHLAAGEAMRIGTGGAFPPVGSWLRSCDGDGWSVMLMSPTGRTFECRASASWVMFAHRGRDHPALVGSLSQQESTTSPWSDVVDCSCVTR